MAAILASTCSTSSISNLKLGNPKVAKRHSKMKILATKTETEKYGSINGRANKMVPTTELARTNGSINGSRVAGDRSGLVKSDKGPSNLVSTQKGKRTDKDASFEEELRVLPSDEGFSWAKDSYNAWQRTIDIWSFVLSLRVRVLFDNAKWAYAGGFSEEKQVSSLL
jgi:hypothetical protein